MRSRTQTGADRTALADVLVRLSAETRAQLRLKHDISRTLIDLRVVREFQRKVFEVIAGESPEAARRTGSRNARPCAGAWTCRPSMAPGGSPRQAARHATATGVCKNHSRSCVPPSVGAS